MNSRTLLTRLDDLVFDNRFIRELPGDPETANYRRQVAGACYSRVLPTQVSAPQLVAYSKEVAELLDLSPELCASDDFFQVFAGNRLVQGMEPYAMCYGGHQFGYWAGQLGDGRAINLGEVANRRGERWTLQLKGAGATPYSRNADGLAVLRSSIREFLCSEAMHHLGVPTTRALSVVLTGEAVIRDMFYNGNPRAEPGAVVCRVAPSFTRFGNFQILAARGEIDLLRRFVDYTIRIDFPHLGEPSPAVYADWFLEVCRRTAGMIVHWQRVGFVHGVMNTDNMSILGLTIDYGPYGWLENYDPHWTPNTTDAEERRYRFGQQPQIGYWNLGQLANALYPLFGEAEPLQAGLKAYAETFDQGWQQTMVGKLGLVAYRPETDDDLVAELFALLQRAETDMTLFFRRLAGLTIATEHEGWETEMTALLQDSYYLPEQLTPEYRERLSHWLRHYRERLRRDGLADAERRSRMNAVNPKYVLRNYLAQLAIDKAEQGDFAMVDELLDLLRRPYDEQPGKDHCAAKRPDWARSRPGCSMLSCSS
ncbi:protein adenylyltransferase SelO family protein [Methylomicrobium sp. Wu6]|uniref:protein adenylyltransferase SelO n=1 Tax=Methylomicrobium sp. Wu6 TaxID=3107928 RepID=UPI002DD6663C|nr:YdiU family protein [Methylomicrobium sp. Wu6]MEC4748022.1 YdiU family protein [Methylomicrobium sp. Wu6]